MSRGNLLKARDPSILACNLAGSSRITECVPSEEQNQNHLNVYLRIKPGVSNYEDLYEVRDSRTLISKIPEGSHSARNVKDGDLVRRKYDFTKIFGPLTKQIDVFNELVKPQFFKFINGDNSTLLTYGVSSSGKTYTIVGTSQEPGLVPRSLEYLFRTLPKLNGYPEIKPLPNGQISRLTHTKISDEVKIRQNILDFNWKTIDRTEHVNTYCKMQARLSEDPVAVADYDASDLVVTVWVSFAEIYNEHIHDLLQPEIASGKPKPKMKLGSLDGHTYIKNLTNVYVSSGLEAYQVLQYGLHHLNFAKTKINSHSSRSHSIFTITLAQGSHSEYRVSRFNFCDLAGAERSKKTLNVGDRLKESNNINTSLLVLGRCIAGVRSLQKISNLKLVPFRDSKLTQLFQRALSGQENISMMVNVNPCRELFDETQHVLNFSAIAKEVLVTQQVKTVVRGSGRFSEYIQGNSTQVNFQSNDDEEIASKEKRIEELRNMVSEYTTKIEEEEVDQEMEQFQTRAELIAKYHQRLEEQTEQLQMELHEKEIALKREYKKKLKAHKLAVFNSKKEFYSDLSLTSDSSDDEIEIGRPLKLSSRKRKHSVDLETVVVYSSEEEEEHEFWKSKVQTQEKTKGALLEAKTALQDRINKMKVDNELKKSELMELIEWRKTA